MSRVPPLTCPRPLCLRNSGPWVEGFGPGEGEGEGEGE